MRKRNLWNELSLTMLVFNNRRVNILFCFTSWMLWGKRILIREIAHFQWFVMWWTSFMICGTRNLQISVRFCKFPQLRIQNMPSTFQSGEKGDKSVTIKYDLTKSMMLMSWIKVLLIILFQPALLSYNWRHYKTVHISAEVNWITCILQVYDINNFKPVVKNMNCSYTYN